MTGFFERENNSDYLSDAEFNQQYARFETDDRTQLGVIFIEDISDKNFWKKIAFRHQVEVYSKNKQLITGKSKLLQISHSLNQLIAIDSDFDDLCPQHRPESILYSSKKDYILKTYTHSLENLIFSPECLSEILDKKFKLHLDNHNNDIVEIFTKLSKIWFEPYSKFLYLYNQNGEKFNKWKKYNEWIKLLYFKENKQQNKKSKRNKHKKESIECQEIALKLDFSIYEKRLSRLNKKLNQYIDKPNEFHDFCKHLEQQMYTPETVWAFIRGHDFEEEFVDNLMNAIIEDRQQKEVGYIEKKFSDTPENSLNQEKGKIYNLAKEINATKTVLHHYFHDVYFPQAKDNHFFLQKIVADYAKIIQAA